MTDSLVQVIDTAALVHPVAAEAAAPRPEVPRPVVPEPVDTLSIDSLACDSLATDSLAEVVVEEVPAPPTGDVEGVVRQFPVGDQNEVGLLVIVSFLLLVDILSRSWKYLQRAITDFFYPTDHNNIYDDNTPDNHLHGGLSLTLLATGSISLLTYYFVPTVSLWVWLAVSLAYIVVKIGIYGIVNFTYFDSQSRHHWRAGYRLLILLLSLLTGGIALIGIYTPLSSRYVIIAAVLAVGVVKLLLLVKTLRTFFKGPHSLLHFILYFCTLEIVPILALLAIILHG